MVSPEEIFVFLGPTLSAKEATQTLQARYFPPAKQGDILSLVVQFKPKVVALIDGYFGQDLSVWHKEILFALDKGVLVFGASSMGALRAAETAEFGMIGVGKIYELYKDGVLNDDDEVALAHGPAEEEYLPLSLPLVNIRFTLLRAAQEEKIPQEYCDQIIACARSLFFPNRTAQAIASAAKNMGLCAEDVVRWLTRYYVDQKKEDALLLLEKIKNLSYEERPKQEKFFWTTLFHSLYHYERRTYFSSTSLSQRQLAQYISLNHPDFHELQFQAFNRLLADILGKLLRIEVSEEEIEEEKKRFCMRTSQLFLNEEERNEWLSRNHLSHEDFEQLMRERATARKLHHSTMGGLTPWQSTKALLDELKLMNKYEEWSKKAAKEQSLFEEICPCYHETDHQELEGDELVEEHLFSTSWRPDSPYPQWMKEAGFHDLSELKVEMHKAKIVRENQKNNCRELLQQLCLEKTPEE